MMSFDYDTLSEINRSINENVQYVSDSDQYHLSEFWEVAKDKGDCEDYALKKFKLCAERGIPLESMRLAVCGVFNPLGDHAVLLVTDSEKQTWVLDNRYPYPMAYQDLTYTWVSIFNPVDKKWHKPVLT